MDALMNSDDIQARYLAVQHIARTAAAMGLEYFRCRETLAVMHKEDPQDAVTQADQALEAYICCELAMAFPEDGLLGEESGASCLQARYLWIIDPIDGTSCFLHGLPGWCVSIGLLDDGKPVLGAIADAVHAELFHACQGQGAFVNDTPLNVSPARSLAEGLVGVGTTYKQGRETFWPFLQGVLDSGGMFVRHGSSAITLAYVAAGRLLGYYETCLKSWDCLAGLVILQEAGGLADDFFAVGRSRLMEGQPLMAGCPGVYDQLSALRGASGLLGLVPGG